MLPPPYFEARTVQEYYCYDSSARHARARRATSQCSAQQALGTTGSRSRAGGGARRAYALLNRDKFLIF